MLLYGKNSVIERLKSNPLTIKKVLVQDHPKNAGIIKLCEDKKIFFQRMRKEQFNKMRDVAGSQSVAAVVDDFKYADFDEILESESHLFIFLDRLYDPQNLGAIMRVAACFGGFAIVIPKYKACPVTEAALHIACGAENYAPVCLVTNLKNALIKAKDKGIWVIGAVLDEDAKPISEVEFPFPVCFVLGSEGEGMRYGIGKHLDVKVKIPMEHGLSFNISAACAIFCYEINKQRSLIH